MGRANKRLTSGSSEVTHSLYEKCFIPSGIVCCLSSSAINSISRELSKHMHWIFESLYFPVFPIIWFRGFRNQGIELGCFFSLFRKTHCIEVCITIFLICYISQIWHQLWMVFVSFCLFLIIQQYELGIGWLVTKIFPSYFIIHKSFISVLLLKYIISL